MGAQWTNDLKIGHESIDNQHQELFQLVSMLDSAIHANSLDKIESIILFLEHYVDTHFSEEENLMLAHHFEGYSHHKEDHDIFKARVFSLRHDFDSGFSPAKLYFAIRMFIDKLVIHIKTIDVKIASISHHQGDH